VNDITIRLKKISKFLSNDDDIGLGEFAGTDDSDNNDDDSGNDDKPYTHEQIAKLLEFADIRTKVM
jgi:hypothetical protein